MGLWDITKRMIQGKPAFIVDDENYAVDDRHRGHEPTANDNALDTKRVAANGRKILPEAWAGKCQYHINNSHMQVYAHVHNHSSVPIFLDKIQLAGRTRELDYPLKAGSSWEFKIYDGPALTSGSYTEANLYYRDDGNGDYFRSRHFVEYNFERGFYAIEELHPIRPVIDT